MKKIGIITLNGYFNYGNRLQNYALQEILKSFGFYVETILVDNKVNSKQEKNCLKTINRIKNIKNKPIHVILQRVEKKLWNMVNKHNIKKAKLVKTEVFKKFTRDYINETKFYISDNNIPKDLTERYDYFVVGSDQVWNPYFILGSSIYFLTFAPKYMRIAYAPSFGISELSEKYIERIKKWLSGMNYLSVREASGAKIIHELTGRKAEVLVDPTLLLSKEDWLAIAKEAPKKPRKKYILTYFLGEMSIDQRKKINEIARKNSFQLVNLANIHDLKNYIVNPCEFIDYLYSSSIIFTNSFHGTIFSILFEKPFVVFDRKSKHNFSMKSRFETLLSTFKLEDRKWENIRKMEDILNVDFSHIPKILEMERYKAFAYFRGVFNICNAK